MVFQVTDTPSHWVAEKDLGSTPLDIKHKETKRGEVTFERGLRNGEIVLRRVFYPKDLFSKTEVLNILSSLEDKCPLCKGSNTSFTPTSNSKQRGEMGNMPESIFSILDRVTGDPEASRAVGTELLSLAIQEPLKLLTTQLGEKIMDLVVATGLTAASFVKDIGHRAQMDALQMGMHFFNQLIDPRPEELESMKADIDRLRSAISLGSANAVFDVFFKIPRISLPSLSLPSLSLPTLNLPKIELPAGLKLPMPTLSPPSPIPPMFSQEIHLPPVAAELGSGVVPSGEVDVSEFAKLDRLAVF